MTFFHKVTGTKQTGKGTFPTVNKHVLLQMISPLEATFTNFTDKRPMVTVNADVPLQVVLPSKTLIADFTFKKPTISVLFHIRRFPMKVFSTI